MSETIRVFAGDCTITFESANDQTERGRVIVIIKPDRTVLVHDTDGYQPVAWLTRSDSITVECDAGGFGITARAGEQVLRIIGHEVTGRAEYPATEAGTPVGTHPKTGESLVQTSDIIFGTDSDIKYPLPTGATVQDESCETCGLPMIEVTAGERFRICLDRNCESLDDAVRERFEDEWTCPDCGSPMQIIRRRGRLLVGCSGYPTCESAFAIPTGVVVDTCPCGLPVFKTSQGQRCLDGTCELLGDVDADSKTLDDTADGNTGND
ncbi:topoisomerase DNA-binding C4 zinc finger domain-containing protein [Haloquadratum walsbyi]|uniref:Putative nuclease of the RecB family n=1 Tax=Haloquadratum walsbyi J07HQW2 TaxID=1238425 RepID=U1PQE4_9EURY|nr:topoisomerase DNA-binding C4 zinc finger domain-containing protein [Haloquadratum walsbyi]ERG95977.1 MAG: putative nuclease of the RecB family [Haloquadratum walsbyi J07HQW2]